MISLYESILQSTDSGKKNYMLNKTIAAVNKVLSTTGSYVMEKFMRDNNLVLDDDIAKRIQDKLYKSNYLPYVAVPYKSKDSEPIEFGTMSKSGFAYCDVIAEYSVPERKGASVSSICERIFSMGKNWMVMLAIPETEKLLKEMDKHFSKHAVDTSVNYGGRSSFTSRIGGKYHIYFFDDLIKEFV